MSLFVKERLYIGEATVASIAGLIFGPHCLGWFDPLSWGESEDITLEISRIVLCVQIVAVAVELPKKYMKKHWLSVAILLLPIMTIGWLVVGLFIWILIPHFSFLAALLVSACVTATDPVLAAAVVGKGKFAERVPGHLRNLLSAESGCNDGMAFPFIFLSLNLLIHPGNAGEIVKDWILATILYQCIFGIVLGATLGYLLRKLVALAEKTNTIDRESFLAFFIFLAFNSAGFGSILGVDDLLVSFAAGTAFGWNGDFARKTEESHVSTVIDLIINLAFFVYFGAIIPWQEFNDTHLGLDIWRLIVLAIVIIFLRRLPAVIAFKPLTPDIKSWREAIFCGHFGPIGVGAIFASILARKDLEEHYFHESSKLDFELEENKPFHQLLNTIWPIVNFIVITSIVVHGSSVAVLTLGKRLNRMAITMTLTNTNGNEHSTNWLSRLQKLERSNTSFSLHRMDSSTTLQSSNLGEKDLEALRQYETVETSGVKYRPAGGAKRKLKSKKSKKSKLMKNLSRSVTNDVPNEDVPAKHKPAAQFLQLGRDENENENENDSNSLTDEGQSSKDREVVGTAYKEGNKVVVEDDLGEIIREIALDNNENSPSKDSNNELLSIHSMKSLERHMSMYSSASDDSAAKASTDTPQEQSDPNTHHLPGLSKMTTARKAFYKKNDPTHQKVFAHQIDNVLIIENEDGDIIRRYRVNLHPKQKEARSRSGTVMSKALSLVGLKKKDSGAPDLEKQEPVLTPEFDSGNPNLQSSKVNKQLENHITKALVDEDSSKTSAMIVLPKIQEPEDHEDVVPEEVSEDSEFDDENEEEEEVDGVDDEDLEETEVEKARRLAALGHVAATRHEDDEED